MGDGLANVTPLRALGDGNTAITSMAAVGSRIADEIDEILPVMGATYRREVPEYAAMPPDEFANVLEVSRAWVLRFVEHLVDGAERPVHDRAALLAAGRRRQEMGLSLDAAMHVFRAASRAGWNVLSDASAEIDPTVVSELAARWIEYVDHSATSFAEGHTTATSEHLRRVDARRQALLSDLLAAEDEAAARAVGARHAVHLADRYSPVLVATSEPFSVEDRLRQVLPRDAILGARSDHVLALLPATGSDGVPPGLDIAAAEGPVAHGDPARPGGGLTTEVARAESVLQAMLVVGGGGVHGPGSLLLHRVVREHDALERHLRDRVLAVIAHADPDGIFRETLRAFADHGSVRDVAEQLFVHPNTVTYRLRRVRELTGLDPRVPTQSAVLVLALALQDVIEDSAQEAER